MGDVEKAGDERIEREMERFTRRRKPRRRRQQAGETKQRRLRAKEVVLKFKDVAEEYCWRSR